VCCHVSHFSISSLSICYSQLTKSSYPPAAESQPKTRRIGTSSTPSKVIGRVFFSFVIFLPFSFSPPMWTCFEFKPFFSSGSYFTNNKCDATCCWSLRFSRFRLFFFFPVFSHTLSGRVHFSFTLPEAGCKGWILFSFHLFPFLKNLFK